MAGPCRIGDSLGVVEGDFAVVGDDLVVTALTVVDVNAPRGQEKDLF